MAVVVDRSTIYCPDNIYGKCLINCPLPPSGEDDHCRNLEIYVVDGIPKDLELS